MGAFDHFPYTNFHELNLQWILKALDEIQVTMKQFVSLNTIKYADPIQWDITSQYEKNTIVIDPQTGTAYISVQPVPDGVIITNTDYWTVVFDLGDFVVKMAQNLCAIYEPDTTLTATIPSNYNDWLIWNDTLYRNINPGGILAGDTYVEGSNIEAFTIEDVVGHIETLTTTDKSNLVAAINELVSAIAVIDGNIGDLASLTTTDKSNLVAAINEVVTNLGDLTTLATTDKSSLVAAINEIMTTIGDIYVHDVTFNIPADYANAQEVVDYLMYKILGPNIIIQYADGNYYGPQLSAFDVDMGHVAIKGNEADPKAVTIYIDANEIAFDIRESKVGYINGFRILGTTRSNTDLITDINQPVYWNGQNCGIIAQYNSFVLLGKALIIGNCYYGIQSVYNSCVETLTGDSVDTTTIVANLTSDKEYYAGHNITVYNSGDVAVQAYADSSIDAFDIITLCGKSEDYKLGYGLMAEDGSYIRVNHCYSLWNWAASLMSQSGSSLVSNDCIMWNDPHQSVLVYDAYATLTNFSIKSAYGIRCVASSIKSNGGTCELNSGQTNTCYDLVNSCMTLYDDTNAWGGLYGYYLDQTSEIVNPQHMIFLGSGNTYNYFRPVMISTTIPAGTFPNGMLVINPNADNDSPGWFNTSNGWMSLAKLENHVGQLKYESNGTLSYWDGTQWVTCTFIYGTVRYDNVRHVLQYCDPGTLNYIDIAEIALDPKTGEVKYESGDLQYWDGTQWVVINP